jgi:tetratricopeptide (TPR) repeat protein
MPVTVERRVEGLWVWAGGGPTPLARIFDPVPQFKRESRQVSLTCSGGAARVGGLHLEGVSEAYRRSNVGTGDRFFELQAWDVALDQYRFAVVEPPRLEIEWEAFFKTALCRLMEAETTGAVAGYTEAAEGLARVLRQAPHSRAARGAQLALAVAVAHLDNADRFADVLPGPSTQSTASRTSYDDVAEADDPLSAVQRFFLNRAFGESVDPVEAQRAARKAVEECANRPDLHCADSMWRLAETFYRHRLYADAERSARDLLKLLEEVSARQRALGILDEGRRGKPEDEARLRAIALYGTAQDVANFEIRGREIVARSMACTGRPLEAANLLDAWRSGLDERHVAPRANLLLLKADLLRIAGGTTESILAYRLVVAADNEVYSVPASQHLARTLLASGDLRGAEEALDMAEKRRPKYAGAFEYDRAFIEMARGDLEKARSRFAEAAAGRAFDERVAEVCRFLCGRASRRKMEIAVASLPTARAYAEFFAAVAEELAGRPKTALEMYRRAESLCWGRESPYWMVKHRIAEIEKSGVK